MAENESWAKKLCRFLAYVNQSDWRARQILKLVPEMRNARTVASLIDEAVADFKRNNQVAASRDKAPIPESDLSALIGVKGISPVHFAVIDAADSWVLETLKDAGRAPNDNEWQRFLSGPLDGMIGMSFALQWRYNFGRLFGSSLDERHDGGN